MSWQVRNYTRYNFFPSENHIRKLFTQKQSRLRKYCRKQLNSLLKNSRRDIVPASDFLLWDTTRDYKNRHLPWLNSRCRIFTTHLGETRQKTWSIWTWNCNSHKVMIRNALFYNIFLESICTCMKFPFSKLNSESVRHYSLNFNGRRKSYLTQSKFSVVETDTDHVASQISIKETYTDISQRCS